MAESKDIAAYKKELKELMQNKGIASKAVGNAKKNGLSYNNLIADVQDISKKIALLKKKIQSNKAIKEEAAVCDELASIMPPQFSSRDEKLMADVSINSNPDMHIWDSYIAQHKNASIYHSSQIRSVIENSFGHTCYYLTAENKAQKICGVLPLVELNSPLFGHFIVSVPFFNYGGVLADSSGIAQQLCEEAASLANSLGAQHIEYRHCYQAVDMPARSDKIAMLLQLPSSVDVLWEQIGTKLRAQIKKPQRQNTKTVVGREELLDDYYKVFSCNMRDLGTPVYSKMFFKNMLKYNETANIVVVYLNGQPVSTGFVLGWRNTLEIPWASTLRKANKHDVNMLLYWAVLQFAINEDYKVFDFGRSSKVANTYRFKKQWGAKPHQLYWHYWLPNNNEMPQINPDNPKYKLLINAWKRLPVWLANQIGPRLVKNIP